MSVYLSVQQLIPEDRLQTLFADVFDLNIATATLFMITGNPTDVLHALCNAHPQALKEFAAIYDEIVSEGFTYHNSKYPFAKPARGSQKRHKGHNLLIRFRDFKLAILSCLSDFLVPFTNNLAEQDIRMMKLKQKISGTFRTLQGAQGFCTIRSFIFTHRKLNHNLFRSIQLALA